MKNKILFQIAIVLLVLFSITACHDLNNDKEDKVTFENINWELKAYGDKTDPQDVLSTAFVTAFFDQTEASVTGSGGCNSYSGAYMLEEGKLTVSPLMYTAAFCQEPEGVMQQEQQLFTLFPDAVAYQFADEHLKITCTDDQILLFEKITEIEVGMEQNGTQVSLEKGDFLLVSLSSNASTGYLWEVAEVNASVLQQIGASEYVSPEPTEPPALGASGSEIFRFRAVGSGSSSLILVYKQPWVEDAAITYVLDVFSTGE
jgi:predicted secreted protein/heat shock protein HslJ